MGPQGIEQRFRRRRLEPFDIGIAPPAEVETGGSCHWVPAHRGMPGTGCLVRIVAGLNPLAHKTTAVVGAVVLDPTALQLLLQAAGKEIHAASMPQIQVSPPSLGISRA